MGYYEETKPIVGRGELKLYLKDGSESSLNLYINRRDATVYKTEYRDGEGYNPYYITRFFFCMDNKSECGSLIMQHIEGKDTIVREESMSFDSGFGHTLENLVRGNTEYKSNYGNVELYVNNYYQGE